MGGRTNPVPFKDRYAISTSVKKNYVIHYVFSYISASIRKLLAASCEVYFALLLRASLVALIAMKTELEPSSQVPQMFVGDLGINQNVNMFKMI